MRGGGGSAAHVMRRVFQCVLQYGAVRYRVLQSVATVYRCETERRRCEVAAAGLRK